MKYLSVGNLVEAVVTSIEDYGIWVKYYDYEGLIPIIEVSWKWGPINPKDYAIVGEKLKVKVLRIKKYKFYASLKEVHPQNNPWLSLPNEGDIFQLPVISQVEYGYFFEIKPNLLGFLYIKDTHQNYQRGDYVTLKVSQVDGDRQRISLIEIT